MRGISDIDRRMAAMHELGKITVYSADTKSGLIKTSEGVPLYFSLGEWRSEGTEPKPGLTVKFIHGFYAARDVQAVLPAGKSK
jgi:hypothetical protein